MITKESLRIGNLVLATGSLTKGAIHTVTGIDANMVYMHNVALSYGNIDGIPLSEKWLNKCGFKADAKEWTDWGYGMKCNRFEYQGENMMFQIGQNQQYGSFHRLISGGSSEDEYGWYDGIELKYIHQLQNLYFALCGQELQIRL